MIRTAALIAIGLTLAACASSSRYVEPISVSMDQYMKLSCSELKDEQDTAIGYGCWRGILASTVSG